MPPAPPRPPALDEATHRRASRARMRAPPRAARARARARSSARGARTKAMSAEFIERRTREWVDAFVVDGARVCPFASRAKLRVRVCEDASEAGACEAVVREAAALAATVDDEGGGGAWTTTIIVAPSVDAFAGDFGAMLDAQEVIDEALVVSGLEGEVQCVAFHPSFVFAGESPDDAGNFTNRSPWPSWHILREIDVSDAVDDFAVDARETPARNARNLREIGYDALAEALVRFQRE